MMKCLVKVFLTLVVFAFSAKYDRCYAAPTQTAPNLEKAEQESPPELSSTEPLDPMTVTPPPQQQAVQKKVSVEKEYFYPFQTAMGPRLGVIFDAEKMQNKEPMPIILGFYYMMKSITSRHFELGADLRSDTNGAVFGGMRWVYSPTESLRPSSKAQIVMLLEPNKGLANMIDYRQYAARFGIGLEDSLNDPVSLKWDIELDIGFRGFSANLVFGYSWAW